MDASKSKRFDKKALDKLKPEQVGYFDGSPPAVEDYDTWLRRQPFEVQLRHLDGDEDRLALWQRGNVKLKQFTTAKGNAVDVAALRRLDNRSVEAPIRQSPYETAENHLFKVEAYRIGDLLSSPKARKQLQQLFVIDADNTVSPLSTTDYKGILKDTKRSNRIKANTITEKDFYFDPVSGQTYNPWIYRPNRDVLQLSLIHI